MNDPKQVRDALVTVLKTLKVAQGYENDLPDAKIYPRYDAVVLGNREDASFPKCMVALIGGDDEKLPGRSAKTELNALILLAVKKVLTNQDPQDMLYSYLKDLSSLFLNNHTLGGTVQDVSAEGYELDGGVLAPEGNMILRLRITTFSNV